MVKDEIIFWNLYHSNYSALLPNLREVGILKYLKKHHRILEIGSGKGRNLKFLQKLGYENLFGIEVSNIIFSYFKNTENCINVIKADGSFMPFRDRQFNAILLIGVLSTINNFEARDKLLCEIESVCKDDGLIIFIDYIYDLHREKEYKKNEIIFNYRGMFKPKWSSIPFVHYSCKILNEIFGRYHILHKKEVDLYSCRKNINAGICMVLNK